MTQLKSTENEKCLVHFFEGPCEKLAIISFHTPLQKLEAEIKDRGCFADEVGILPLNWKTKDEFKLNGFYVWEGKTIYSKIDTHWGSEWDVQFKGLFRELLDYEWDLLKQNKNPFA